MASSGKKKTTMAKLMRESRLRERRMDKAARKDARKLAAVDSPGGGIAMMDHETGEYVTAPADDAVAPALVEN